MKASMLRRLRRRAAGSSSALCWRVARRHGHVVCLGEPLLCVAPAAGGGGAAEQGEAWRVRATGAELLTACAATRLGQDASLVTALTASATTTVMRDERGRSAAD